MRLRTIFLLWSVTFGVLAAQDNAWADCTLNSDEFANAITSRLWDEAKENVTEIQDNPECGPADAMVSKQILGDALTKASSEVANEMEAQKLLIDAANLKASWRANRRLGELWLSEKKYADAAETFMAALEVIDSLEAGQSLSDSTASTKVGLSEGTYIDPVSEQLVRILPLKDEIDELVNLADEARQLASSQPGGILIRAPQNTRSGRVGGVFGSVANRGAEAFKVPVPIIFEYNSDSFTSVGKDAADELINVLKEFSPGSIQIVGHTDKVGSDEYNNKLSLKRAKRVKEYLETNGISGTITTEGVGKSQPRKLSGSYTEQEIDQLNRRVEFSWN